MMTDWYNTMIKTLQLNGKGERTQESYARAVRMLTEHCKKAPESITQEELQEYFLHRKNVSKWAPKTMRICYCGIRFFYVNVLRHNWHIFLYGQEYIKRYGDVMPSSHLKVINAIIRCRTQAYGMTVYQCEGCGQIHHVFRSCGNRHCPQCQNHKIRKWLNKQLENQLPGHHFMITFTVPESLRPFMRSHQRICYSALFKASSDSMKRLAPDEKFIGGDLPGFFGVLHTWGRQLQYHPHIHYVVPGGALSKKDGLWHPSRIDFYLPVKALSKIYKAKFRDEMQKAGMLNAIPPEAWQTDWNVNCQAVGSSEQTIKYLAPYIFKVAISNSRILKFEDRKVVLRYKKHKSSRWRSITLDVMEFIRRFLQHVLPEGFMKVRYYGFMNPTSSISLDKIAALIELSYAFTIEKTDPIIASPPEPVCPACGGKLAFRYAILPIYTSIFLDSG